MGSLFFQGDGGRGKDGVGGSGSVSGHRAIATLAGCTNHALEFDVFLRSTGPLFKRISFVGCLWDICFFQGDWVRGKDGVGRSESLLGRRAVAVLAGCADHALPSRPIYPQYDLAFPRKSKGMRVLIALA